MNYAFLLGREAKLSAAEIYILFPEMNILFCSSTILLANNIEEAKLLAQLKNMGWVIKVFEAETVTEEIQELLCQRANSDSKFKYGLSLYGDKKVFKEVLLWAKRYLKESWFSSRYVNKDNKNLSSAQILGEKLVDSGTDFNYIPGEINYFGKTIWVQNINEYSKRDYDKHRDMQIGMLPPKLAQMMVNLSQWNTVYDPFVGLGTVLIESVMMGNKKVFWSDINEKMVETSKNNVEKLEWDHLVKTMKLNAKFIQESPYFAEWVDVIVTEGYLGEIMTKANISRERIIKQRESLIKIYEVFFAKLKEINFKWNIIICFPYWDMKGKVYYFDEVYTVLEEFCSIQTMLPKGIHLQTTDRWSLLYKREKQLVGREIFKLAIK